MLSVYGSAQNTMHLSCLKLFLHLSLNYNLKFTFHDVLLYTFHLDWHSIHNQFLNKIEYVLQSGCFYAKLAFSPLVADFNLLGFCAETVSEGQFNHLLLYEMDAIRKVLILNQDLLLFKF